MLIINMTGYVLFWYLLGVKLPWGHAHKTRSWYLLGVALRKSNEHPSHFYMGVPPLPGPCLHIRKLVTYILIELIQFLISQLVWRYLKLHKIPRQVSSLLQFCQVFKQPLQNGVHNQLVALDKPIAESVPDWFEKKKTQNNLDCFLAGSL